MRQPKLFQAIGLLNEAMEDERFGNGLDDVQIEALAILKASLDGVKKAKWLLDQRDIRLSSEAFF